MPRERRTSLFPIAVSPARAADSLGIRAEEINEAIKRGELHCYVKGIRSRVLIADLGRVLIKRAVVSAAGWNVPFAPIATELLHRHTATRMGWTGRAPAPTGFG